MALFLDAWFENRANIPQIAWMVSVVELFRANHGSAGSLIFHVKFSCAIQLSHAHGNWKLGKAQSGTRNPLPSQTRAGSGRYLSYLAIISAQQWQKWQGTKELLMLTLNKLIKRDGQQPEEMNWAQFVKGIAASQCECCLSASFASLLPKSTPAVLQRSETTLQVRWYTFLIRFSLCSLQ